MSRNRTPGHTPHPDADDAHPAPVERADSVADERALQHELQREAQEGRGLLGDTASARHLDGPSTWITLPPGVQDVLDGS